MADIRLIATDLDGTLIGSASDLPLYMSFKDKLNHLRARFDTKWVACTGRSMGSFQAFFFPMRTMGVMPDFVIIRHAYIYGLTKCGYVPHVIWNLRTRYLEWANELHIASAIDEWHRMITGSCLGVTTIRKKRDRLCLRFDSQESVVAVVKMLEEKMRPFKQLQVVKGPKELDIRCIPFTKGLSVKELARHLGVSFENVLAMGNGHNDISMLDGAIAGMTGCPSNSEHAVVETVHKSGGHIAKGRALAGVMEIMDAYMSGEVNNDFPEGWNSRSDLYDPSWRPSSSHSRPNPSARGFWLAIIILYTVLIVFAYFGVMPFSGLILKPLKILLWPLKKIILWL